MTAQPLIVKFSDIDKEDIAYVGGKAANLGEMVRAGFPVPPGFVITVYAYNDFIKENNLNSEIRDVLKQTDVEQPEQLQEAAEYIQGKINRSEIPKETTNAIIAAYKKLSGRLRMALVAARSSTTVENFPAASAAGLQATFLNVAGEANLLLSVRDCWSLLFSAGAIFYREQNNIPPGRVKTAVIVQKMVQSEVSGIAFTIDPVTGERDRIVINAAWGLGETIVQGRVSPDKYIIQKGTFSILSKEISDQSIQLIRKAGKTKEVAVAKNKSAKQKLSDLEIVKLAKIVDKIQRHYYFPQDIEWAREDKHLYILETKPVTTITEKLQTLRTLKEIEGAQIRIAQSPLLTGTPASPGIGTGPVKIIKSPKEINKVKPQDVIVTEITTPEFIPAMSKASAVVTDKGVQTSHTAIVCRELGVPCVVGTGQATRRLNDGVVVTVDGSRGYIFLGSKVKIETKPTGPEEKVTKLKTATKLYVNLAEPERAKEVAKQNVDGVGLLRAEFMIRNIGIHPKEAIKEKKQDKFIDKLTSDLAIFCKAFNPRPVVYRTTDFKTNEYRQLTGGSVWEPEEANPMLGFRGALRYTAHPDVFNLELQAIKRVREKYNNLWVMLPFVRSPEELAKTRRIIVAEGLFESSTFKFWMMVELPVNVILIDEFIKVGIDGISVGSNDLTMLTLGVDRDNAHVAQAFDERSPAVIWALKRVIAHCEKYDVTSSICGRAPSVHDDLVERLVKEGVTSISVNPEAVNRVRQVIYETEKEVARGSRKK